MANNIKCVLCKTEYEYCSGCRKHRLEPIWKKLYCSENCKNIFTALNDYSFKKATKEETKELLSKCDLSLDLNDYYRGEIEEIMSKPKRGFRQKANIIDEVIDVELVEETKECLEEESNGVVIAE